MSLLRDLRFFSRISSGLWTGLKFRRTSKRAITVFGSARVSPTHPYYEEAKKLSYEIAKRGFAIVTGGGGAIMQAANEGAHLAGGESIGINIEISNEHQLNSFVKKGHKSRYFFVRKVLLFRYSSAFIVFPGGFGTLDELFEIITLIQTKKSGEHPVILLHAEFWSGLISWCRDTLIPAGMITEAELSRLKLVNTAEEALELLEPLFREPPSTSRPSASA
jgi:uncharacterized protein (TIGR00730 family)